MWVNGVTINISIETVSRNSWGVLIDIGTRPTLFAPAEKTVSSPRFPRGSPTARGTRKLRLRRRRRRNVARRSYSQYVTVTSRHMRGCSAELEITRARDSTREKMCYSLSIREQC